MDKKSGKKERIESIVSDQEKVAIQSFVDNDVQREAVRKLLFFGITQHGAFSKGKTVEPTRNFALGIVQLIQSQGLKNEDIGLRMSSIFEGAQILESAWLELELFKTQEEEPEPKENNAR